MALKDLTSLSFLSSSGSAPPLLISLLQLEQSGFPPLGFSTCSYLSLKCSCCRFPLGSSPVSSNSWLSCHLLNMVLPKHLIQNFTCLLPGIPRLPSLHYAPPWHLFLLIHCIVCFFNLLSFSLSFPPALSLTFTHPPSKCKLQEGRALFYTLLYPHYLVECLTHNRYTTIFAEQIN